MSFPRAELRELVQRLADIGTIWEGDAEPAMGRKSGRPGSRVKLDVKGVHRKGVDEIRATYDQATDSMRQSSNGYRLWSLTIRSESLDANAPGYDVLEDIIARLSWPTTLDELRSMGLAFVRNGDVIPIDYTIDNRSCYAAIVEVTLASVKVLQISDDPGGIIKTVNGGKPGDIPGPT